jgi:outer membrane autotransporter protein
MKRTLFLLVFVAVIAVWCTPSFATMIYTTDNQTFAAASSAQNIILNFGNNTFYLNIGAVVTDTVDIYTANGDYSQLAVSTTANAQGKLVFKGSSTVYGAIGNTSGSLALNSITANDGTTLSFLGPVNLYTGNLSVGTGTVVNFKSGSIGNNTLAMNFTGDGTISLNPNTTVIGALTTYAAQKGTLELGSGSILDGAVGGATGLKVINVIGGDNTAGVSARITGAVDTYSISLGTNILNIGPVGGAATGALTIHDAGVIDTTIASSSVYGHIVPQGALTIGPTLNINVTVPGTTYIPVGTPFNIIDGTSGGVSVVTVTDPTNPLYTFSPDPLAGTAGDGKVTIKMAGTPVTSASNPVGSVLDTAPSSPDLDVVRNAVNNLTSTSAINDAESQLAPSTPSLAAPQVTFQGIRRFDNLWSSRLERCGQVSEPNENQDCRDSKPRSGWWAKGFEYEGHQNARENSTGYTTRTMGTMVAYDRPISENTRVGVGLGYARTTINGKKFDASTDFDTYQLMAYIGHERGNWFVNGNASIGWNNYSSMRHIQYTGVNRKADAQYNGQDYTLFASTGYHFYAKKFTITPLASLQYTRMHLSGYKESGAGDVNLKAKSQGYDFLESGLGVKVERYFTSRKITYVPEVHFNWFHELSNPFVSQTTHYTAPGSSSFKTSGLRVADDTYNVGGGLSLLSCSCSATNWSLEAVYDHEWRDDGYHANQVMLRLTSRF